MSDEQKEHPAPWLAWPIGLALLALGAVLAYQERDADKVHLMFHAGTGVVGLLIIPGVAPMLASSIKQVGGALYPLLPWGKKDGGTPPDGGTP